MKQIRSLVLAVGLALLPAAAPAVAADSQTIVKVALLDMSSVMPSGFSGYGMMGQGFGQGYGMMGQGNGQGYGMMGQGYGGQANGPGYGMMGMMSVRTDVQTVKSGTVTLDVTNWSRSVLHEMLVVAVDNPSAPLPYDFTTASCRRTRSRSWAKPPTWSPMPPRRSSST